MLDRLTKRGGWPYSHPPNCDFDVNRQSPQARGLGGWWPTLGSQGNVLRDYATGRFPGTLQGNAIFQRHAQLGQVLSLDGTDDYVTIADRDRWDQLPFSLVAWVNSDLSQHGGVVSHTEGAPATEGWWWTLLSAGRLNFASNDTDHESPIYFSANTLYCVGLAVTSTGVQHYANGVLIGQNVAAITVNACATTLKIGREFSYYGLGDFRGLIGPVYFFGRHLSAAEFRAIYQNPWELYAPRVRMWPGYVAAVGPTYTLTADQGALTLAGQAAALLAARLLGADAGSLSLGGQSASLLASRLLTAAQGTVAFSGQSASLLASRLLAAAQGTLSLAGQAASLLAGRKLSADAGAISLTGQDATLLVARLLEAAAGIISLTGIDATLIYTPIGGPTYTLTAETGALSMSGPATALLAARLLAGEAGIISFTRQDAALLAARILTAEAGVISLTGQDAAMLRGFLLSAETGAVSVSGQDAGLTLARLLTAESGTLTLAGWPVTFVYSGIVTPDSRIFVIVAEGRVYVVAAESRTHAVPGESRVYAINA